METPASSVIKRSGRFGHCKRSHVYRLVTGAHDDVTSITSHEPQEIPSLNCLSSYGGHDGATDDTIAIRPRLGEKFYGPFLRLGCQRAKDKVAFVRRLDLEIREPRPGEEPTKDAFDHRLCHQVVRYAVRAIIRFSVA